MASHILFFHPKPSLIQLDNLILLIPQVLTYCLSQTPPLLAFTTSLTNTHCNSNSLDPLMDYYILFSLLGCESFFYPSCFNPDCYSCRWYLLKELSKEWNSCEDIRTVNQGRWLSW